jgi:hypothetical protein
LTAGSIAWRRLGAQRLIGEPLPSAPDVVRHLVAVQAQDYPGAKWGIAQRMTGATDAALDAAFDAGAFLRLHTMRPTWHLVAPEDLRWLGALTGPRVHQASAHQYRQLEIDAAIARRAADVFERVLAGRRAMTRDELGEQLLAAGMPATGLRLTYLVLHAEVEAILCSGPRRAGKHTYALVEERVPPAPPRERDAGLAELAERYLAGHGPAQDVDLAWWSGLTLADARRALAAAESALQHEAIDGRTFWSAASPGPTTGAADSRHSAVDSPQRVGIHLLPNFDELLVAFSDRSDALDPALPPPARTADEILSHAIVRDGLVVGRWRRNAGRGAVAIGLDRRVTLGPADEEGLQAAVARYAAFLGRPVSVAVD